MRALSPVREGHVQRGGIRPFFEVYGDGDPTVNLLMPDSIVQSRAWKAQIPFLARTHPVVVLKPHAVQRLLRSAQLNSRCAMRCRR